MKNHPQRAKLMAAKNRVSEFTNKVCEDVRKKLKGVDTKEICESTLNEIRKRPLLGILIAVAIGALLGRISKKLW